MGSIMIHRRRFLVRSTDRERWIETRAKGVTATMVAAAATPRGYERALHELEYGGYDLSHNPYCQFGIQCEPLILSALTEYEVSQNLYLICHDEHRWAMATPDGLSFDHTKVVEAKTTGSDWGSAAKAPIHYRRQIQWQMFVTGASECIFAWMLREVGKQGEFRPAWEKPKIEIVPRDEQMIASLLGVGERLHREIEMIVERNARCRYVEGSGWQPRR